MTDLLFAVISIALVIAWLAHANHAKRELEDCRQQLEWANKEITSILNDLDKLRPHRIPLTLNKIEENNDKIDARIDELNL